MWIRCSEGFSTSSCRRCQRARLFRTRSDRYATSVCLVCCEMKRGGGVEEMGAVFYFCDSRRQMLMVLYLDKYTEILLFFRRAQKTAILLVDSTRQELT